MLRNQREQQSQQIYTGNTQAPFGMWKITKGKNKSFKRQYTIEQKTNDECKTQLIFQQTTKS